MRINPINSYNFKSKKITKPLEKTGSQTKPIENDNETTKALNLLLSNPALFCSFSDDRVILFDPQRGFMLTSRPDDDFVDDFIDEEE